MSSEWRLMTLKEAGVSLIDCDHRTPAALDEGYPYIAIPQLKNGHITLDGVRRISREDYIEWTKKLKPQANDVIVVRRCNSGQSAHIPAGLDCAIGQNLVVLRANGEYVLPEFLRWLVQGPEWWGQVSKFINVGAVFDSLRCRDIPSFEMVIPPRVDQAEIASLLGALDDRITLLRETNATLEAIAQALFKSWFVDFDPVRAKAEGRQPEGMDATTAALFPDSFEESELGLVPKGWSVMPIGEAVECVGGGTPDTKNEAYWQPEEFSWSSPKDLSGLQSPVLLSTERKLSAQGLAKVSSGLLPCGTLLMSSRAPIGYLAIAKTPLAVNQGYIAMLPGGRLPPLYLLFWCREKMEVIKGRANGSTFMEISKKAFRPIPALVPSAAVLEAFADIADPLFERLAKNERQAQTLTQLRDTLLPRLISGQLRLPEAQALLNDRDIAQ
ncbi:restriction endonuclease subunit S [Pseudomonas aeruginosa]|uniref:restriction endonuclease subunit S n=1 Tax=Pseudomonas aeruginosa TaxID=287 RepID=UPI0003BB4C93|nr:restriction endonuclease subunit S [Pseudomonas aeruginosa]ESR70195.1 restriction endonuclease [Pseudomonas aeruginosa VRFPA05]EJV1364807.1 restriction endonuclease subunit S [Pseudomonas aeruginosa]EJV1383957.1 restriction endonuclease subunit S [Pseudomonas aeruginosa]EJV1607502.1 restriction endonuclease subunit S [Pseudomonas aeruginosa]EKD1562123.1 restriction endonuclease subunit S [Pseudomonas aeruginosa]